MGPIDLGATDQRDPLGVVALSDRSLGLDPTDRSLANAVLRSLLAIQGEGPCMAASNASSRRRSTCSGRADVAVALLDETGDSFEIVAAAGRLLAARGGARLSSTI